MFLSGKKILLAKEEVTYGSDPTPTVASNAVEAERVEISYEGDVHERDQMRGDLSPVEPVLGSRHIKLSFEAELKGSGSAGTAPRLGDLFEACGFVETVSAGSSVMYLPASTTMKSVTFYFYELQDSGNAILHKITGARGTFQITAEAGKQAKVAFTFFGLYTIPTDVSAPSAPTFSEPKPPVMESATVTLNGVTSLVVAGVSIDMQNSVTRSDDMSAATGIKSFNITKRRPTAKLAPEAVLMATYDFWSDWVAATARALSFIVGTAAGNKCTISSPKLTLDGIGSPERAGVTTRDLNARLNRSSGNDELSLVFA